MSETELGLLGPWGKKTQDTVMMMDQEISRVMAQRVAGTERS